jgi:hypothetical protein
MLFIVGGIIMHAVFAAADITTAPILIADLSGSQELPDPDADARGSVLFYLSDDGEKLSFKLNVSNMKNVTAAYIQLAPEGRGGRVVATLFNLKEVPKMGRFDGTVSEGVIKANNLVGPLVGNPLSALLKEMGEGHTYVTVHTREHPRGHIRGKIVDPSSPGR